MMAIRKNHNAFKCIMLPIMAPKRITAHICFIFTHKKFACLFATCVCFFVCGSSLIKILLASLQLACAYIHERWESLRKNLSIPGAETRKQPKNANLVHFFLYDCRTIVQIRVELNSTILLVASNYAYLPYGRECSCGSYDMRFLQVSCVVAVYCKYSFTMGSPWPFLSRIRYPLHEFVWGYIVNLASPPIINTTLKPAYQ